MALAQGIRESYLQDVQILRNRGLSVPAIAAQLSNGERVIVARQENRWANMLKEQRRWRYVVFAPSGIAQFTYSRRNGA